MAEFSMPHALQVALRHHQMGRLEPAAAGYREILAHDPDCVDALHYLGVIALQAGRHDAALELIGRAAARAPHLPSVHSNLGEAYSRLHRLDEAVASFRQALALQPDYPDALNNLGNALTAQGRFEDAVASFRQALALRPNAANFHYNLAVALVEHHRFDAAIASFERAVALKADFTEARDHLGHLLRGRGRLAEAVACFRQTRELQPQSATAHYNLGVVLIDHVAADEALGCFQAAIALNPQFTNAYNNLGNLFKDRGRLDEAVACFRQAIVLQPARALSHFNLGVSLIDRGNFDEAMACLRQAIALQPDLTGALYNLGNLLKKRDRPAEAVPYLQRVLALQPDLVEAHNNLGLLFEDQDRLDEAIRCFQRTLSLQPDLAEAHNNLGLAFTKFGRFDDAHACFAQALAFKPELAETHNNLGLALGRQGRRDDAQPCFERALALKPDFIEARVHLGAILKDRGRLDAALACLYAAIALRPDSADAYNNLGNVYKEQSRLDHTVTAFRQALVLQPDRKEIHSNLILTLQYRGNDNSNPLDAELCRWSERHARPLAPFIIPHTNDRTPDRRLRLGYVSPDFCQHPVGLNLLPLFQAHDHDRLEIFCYSHVRATDQVTAVFRTRSDHWREIVALDDAALADLVRRDRIDLLVDLTLHSAHNRLLAFARKPAPVQVSFAGYPGRTGLAAIDHHLTDPYLDPPGSGDARGPDAPFHLPDTFWCYDPQATHLDVTPLPALTNGHLTFGCLNNFCKVNPAVLQLWARVLLAVPDSRLLLLTAEGSHRQGVLEVLAAAGLGADRVRFVPRQSRENYLALYQSIDLGLDTFPYNGHTTSLDSYWMGVPVVTLVGRTSVGRAGWSQLSNLGLTELAAHSEDEFVQIASTLARDLPRLAALRASLRDRMQRSPLMDGPRFARAIEAAYRTLWHRWCDQPSALSGAPS